MLKRMADWLCIVVAAFAALLSGATLAEELKSVDTTAGKPPSDAIVLFDGGSTDAFFSTHGSPCQWPVVDGAMVVKNGFIVSRLHFRDAHLHVEFAEPTEGGKDGGPGNSGVYIHGQYELQIYNSFTKHTPPKETVGALYGIMPPLVNAARPAGEWQVYEIIYTAPRRDEAGKIAEPGEVTAFLNGVLVQHKTHFTESVSHFNPLVFRTTPYTDKIKQSLWKTGAGPLFLQDHGNPVKFRNIWIRPLDDKAKVFQPD